jgi:hypothetical protein
MDLPQWPAELAGIYLPDWAEWLAQDEDGTWRAYEAEPNQQHNGWYENEVGRIQRLLKSAPPEDWRCRLVRIGVRPGLGRVRQV